MALSPFHERRSSFLIALIVLSALTGCGQQSSSVAVQHQATVARASTAGALLPKDDVLQSIDRYGAGPRLQAPASPWREEEARTFTDVLEQRRAEVLVVPFEIQDRGFDRIERALITSDFAVSLQRASRAEIPDPYLVARALGEGQRRYAPLQVQRLADALQVRTIIRGYVGHDGNGHLSLTLTREQRSALDKPWSQLARRSWTGLAFSDVDLPHVVVHRLQGELLSFAAGVRLNAGAPAFTQTSWPWPLPQSPSDLASGASDDPTGDAARFAILATLAPMYPERPRERLAERGLLAAERAPDTDARAPFLRSYFLHLLHRRPAALEALGDAADPASRGLREVLNGNLDRLADATGKTSSSLEAFVLQFELCYLTIEYGGSCDQAKLPDVRRVAEQSQPWRSLVSNHLTDMRLWEVQSNIEVKQMLDEAFPIQGFSLHDLASAAMVVGGTAAEQETLDLSFSRHIQKVLASATSSAFALSPAPGRLDYLQLLESLGESNLLKSVLRTGFMQGLTKEAADQLRIYESVYAGHPAFEELKARILQKVVAAQPDQPNAAVAQELAQARFAAAYLEQGQGTLSAMVLTGTLASPLSPLGKLEAAYVQDFPIRPWWPVVNVSGSLPRQEAFLEKRDDHALTLAELAYAETEVPAFIPQEPFLPLPELRTLVDERFRGSPDAARILSVAGPVETTADPADGLREAIRRDPQSWSNYEQLGDLLMTKDGDLAAAAKVMLSYPGFGGHAKVGGDSVAISNYAYSAGSGFYWLGDFKTARELYRIAADNDDGSYASITSEGRLAMLRGDLRGFVESTREAAQRYQGMFSWRDYFAMLHALGEHQAAWSGFTALADRFQQPEVWISAVVGHRMAGTTPEQLQQWLRSDPVKSSHFFGRSYSADYALLWSSMDRDPLPNLPQLLDDLQGPSQALVDVDGVSTVRPSWSQEGVNQLFIPSEFRRSARVKLPPNTPVRHERTLFADAYVALRAGRYSEAVRKFDDLAAHYTLETEGERYVLPYFAYASARAGDPLHLEQYLQQARVGGDFEAFLAEAFFKGLHGRKQEALEYLKAAFYNRPMENTQPIISEYRYAEACEWLYNDTHEDAYRQRALEWARIQEQVRPEMSWIYTLEARLLKPGPERSRALAMSLYLDPQAKIFASLSTAEKTEARRWLDQNNPFTHLPANGTPDAGRIATTNWRDGENRQLLDRADQLAQ